MRHCNNHTCSLHVSRINCGFPKDLNTNPSSFGDGYSNLHIVRYPPGKTWLFSVSFMASEINRQDLQAAIARTVELRKLHAALSHGSNSSPASLMMPPATSSFLYRMPGDDYPIFTPSYAEDPLPGYHYLQSESRTMSETWGGSMLGREPIEDDIDLFVQNIEKKSFCLNREQQTLLADDQKSTTTSCLNHICPISNSPKAKTFKSSRRINSTESNSITTCNKCKPASISREASGDSKNHQNDTKKVFITDTKLSARQPAKSRSLILSWLFPKTPKIPKPEISQNTVDSDDMRGLFKDWGLLMFESLKKELHEAQESRDAAVEEAVEMRSALEELKNKILKLEMYCENLKKSIEQTQEGNQTPVYVRYNNPRRIESVEGDKDNLLPASDEVMVEGFIQVVSEARLSVKQFCRTLVNQIDGTDDELTKKLNSFLLPYNLTMDLNFSRGVLYHLEALINQTLYQDFENCVFQKDGTPKSLNPHQNRQENFSAFVSLRNLSWNEALSKGTKFYSEEFSRFSDGKMNSMISLLDWSSPWCEDLLRSFFVLAKCIWLLHLLAFSFDPPLLILRVEEGRDFNPHYMEDVFMDNLRHRINPSATVKIMVMPGFYVHERVLKCKVLCRYRS